MSYGSMPPVDQSQYGAGAQRGPAPSTVRQAVWLMYLRAALGALSVLLIFTQRDAIEDNIREANRDFSQDEIDTAVNVGIGVVIALGVIVLVLYLVLARKVLQGRNWARIVTWVIAGLGVVSALVNLGGDYPGLTKGLGLVGGLVDLAIIVLLLLKPSNEYFSRRPAFPG
jgi:hypothetical protein